jgi:hypothetical protein
LLHAAFGNDQLAGFFHAGGISGTSSQFQRKIRLNGGAQLTRAAEINIPTAVRQLRAEDMPHGFA